MRDLEKKRAWNRAWRKRNKSHLRDYEKGRPARPRHTKRASRAAYFRDYRSKNKPTPTLHVRVRKPTKTQLREWRERHFEELSQKTVTEIVTDPELLQLIDEQKKDDKRFLVKFDYSFETVEHPRYEDRNSKIVYDESYAGLT